MSCELVGDDEARAFAMPHAVELKRHGFVEDVAGTTVPIAGPTAQPERSNWGPSEAGRTLGDDYKLLAVRQRPLEEPANGLYWLTCGPNSTELRPPQQPDTGRNQCTGH